MSNNIEKTAALLKERSLLKQEVFKVAKSTFGLFKETFSKVNQDLEPLVNNDEVRLKFEEKGDFEFHSYVGSDVLLVQMHTNVFCFPNSFPILKTSYVEEDKDRAYCGVIHIFNFLADSFLHNRTNDAGYLIARIFVNKEKHFFVEGKGDLGIKYRDFIHGELDEKNMKDIILCAISHAARFDLLSPPSELIETVSVSQMQAVSSHLHLKTAKRLGFRLSADDLEKK